MRELDNGQDFLDVRDIIERVETLRAERRTYLEDWEEQGGTEQDWSIAYPDDAAELSILEPLLDDLRGNGGDHKWEGAWYPVTLIRDSHFEDYAREFAEDIHGDALREAAWPFNFIDWEAAAANLQMDYSTVDYDGVEYWYR